MDEVNRTHRVTIYFIFFISGVSALIYEVVWFRMLARIFGNTVYATSTVLAVFMLGLALGSLYFGRLVDRIRRPLLLYAVLEGGIALAALLMPLAFGFATSSYVSLFHWMGEPSSALPTIRILICFVCLLIPTTLMGGTFPVINRYVVRQPGHLGHRVSALYGINTAGAVLGAGLSGFVLIALWGETNTTLLAVLLNTAVGMVAFILSIRASQRIEAAPTTEAPVPDAAAPQERPKWLLPLLFTTVFVCGLTALSYEVLWTRVLALFLGTSIYAFSTIVVVFLTGIAMGSIIVSRYIDRIENRLSLLGLTVFAIGAAALAIEHFFYRFGQIPSLVALRWKGITHWSDMGSFFLSSALVILAVTLLFGMAFPLAVRTAIDNLGRFGKRLGSLYAANTVGAVVGPLVAGFVLIPLFGTHRSIIMFAVVNAGLGVCIIAMAKKLSTFRWAVAVSIGTIAICVLSITAKDPFLGTVKAEAARRGFEVIYHAEKADATVTVLKGADTPPILLINGTVISTVAVENILMGHLPIMMHPHPEEVLVICFGIGTAYKSTLLYPVRAQTVEISSNVIDAFLAIDPQAEEIIAHPRGSIRVEDGRTFLLLADKKYDVITIDASPPLYSAGTVNLLTKEFFQMGKERLKPGGQLMLWVPTSSATVEDFRMILRTYTQVFPHLSIWGLPHGSGVMVFGSDAPLALDANRVKSLIAKKAITQDLRVRADRPDAVIKLLNSLFIMDDEKARRFAGEVPVITDDHPYTEFPLLRRTAGTQMMTNAALFFLKGMK